MILLRSALLLLRWLAALLLLLPVLYLLAMGPLWGMAMRHPQPHYPAFMLYQPVVNIAGEHPAFDGWISAYVEQWYPNGVAHRGSITMKRVGKASPAPAATP